jgi:hypothetical protein
MVWWLLLWAISGWITWTFLFFVYEYPVKQFSLFDLLKIFIGGGLTGLIVIVMYIITFLIVFISMVIHDIFEYMKKIIIYKS